MADVELAAVGRRRSAGRLALKRGDEGVALVLATVGVTVLVCCVTSAASAGARKPGLELDRRAPRARLVLDEAVVAESFLSFSAAGEGAASNGRTLEPVAPLTETPPPPVKKEISPLTITGVFFLVPAGLLVIGGVVFIGTGVRRSTEHPASEGPRWGMPPAGFVEAAIGFLGVALGGVLCVPGVFFLRKGIEEQAEWETNALANPAPKSLPPRTAGPVFTWRTTF